MAGDQEQSSAGDQEERTFEVIKLRIAFLQHITTLSGAAIVIILTLVERPETVGKALLLAVPVTMFLIAALISVIGVVFLTVFLTVFKGPAGYNIASGGFATMAAGMAFSAGVVTVAFFAAGGSFRSYTTITYTIVALWGALLFVTLLLLLLPWLWRRFWG
jgi:hypothetical protein